MGKQLAVGKQHIFTSVYDFKDTILGHRHWRVLILLCLIHQVLCLRHEE